MHRFVFACVKFLQTKQSIRRDPLFVDGISIVSLQTRPVAQGCDRKTEFVIPDIGIYQRANRQRKGPTLVLAIHFCTSTEALQVRSGFMLG